MTGIESARRTLTRPPWLGKDTGASQGALHTLLEEGVPEHFIGQRFRLDDELAMIHTKRSELFINTSLASVVHTLEAVAGRFPFYDTDDDEDEVQSASDDVLHIVRRIDPPAAQPERYWSTFVDDMRIGDLTTEAALEAVDHADR